MTSDNTSGAKLLELVGLDQQISKLSVQIKGLPQRQELEKVRAQAADVNSKVEKLEKMRLQLQKKFKLLADKKALIQERLAEVQGRIDESGADFREVASLSKELEGFSQQLAVLADERQALDDQEFKIAEVQEQADKSLKQLAAREVAVMDSLQAENGTLIAQWKELGDERSRLLDLLGSGIAERYEKARATKAGVGAAALHGRICDGCHIELSDGQIGQLRQDGEIGECPSCHRLLVIL